MDVWSASVLIHFDPALSQSRNFPFIDHNNKRPARNSLMLSLKTTPYHSSLYFADMSSYFITLLSFICLFIFNAGNHAHSLNARPPWSLSSSRVICVQVNDFSRQS